MPRRAERETPEQSSIGEGGMVHSPNPPDRSQPPPEEVTLGVGSRSPFVQTEPKPATLDATRGLLPVPPDVEAEVARQQANHPMSPEYLQTLRDRLTLAHYFSDVAVAFRRTPQGIEVVAAGLDEIAAFRRTSTREQRQGVVYGVG